MMAEQIVEAGRDIGGESQRAAIPDHLLLQCRRQMNNDRYFNNLGKDDGGMSPASLFTERIAVVGSDNNDAVVIKVAIFQELYKLAKASVDLAYLRSADRFKTGIIFARRRRDLPGLYGNLMHVLRLCISKDRSE